MLDINIEIRKGVLFVRLNGELNKNTVNIFQQQVINLIKDNGILNVVYNFENLKAIDLKGINLLFYSYELTNNNSGMTYICNLNNSKIKHKVNNSRLLNYICEISDELTALNTINL